MKMYLMVFGHSNLGSHQYHFAAENNERAKEKAIERLENSPCASLTYELFEIDEIIGYQTWIRK